MVTHIRKVRDDGRHDAHDTVYTDSDAVACATMRGGHHFRRVGVQAAIVDVLHEMSAREAMLHHM